MRTEKQKRSRKVYERRTRRSIRLRERTYYRSHKSHIDALHKENAISYRRRCRDIVLAHYGAICVCCGEKEDAFLTIDHKDNDGFKDRKPNTRRGAVDLAKIIRVGFPNNLQILCWNCNCGRAKYANRICPHQQVDKSNLQH